MSLIFLLLYVYLLSLCCPRISVENAHSRKYFYTAHTGNAERVVASGTSKGAVRSRIEVIKPADVIAAIGLDKS